MRKKFTIELECSDERERDIIFDIISEHELIPTLYRNHSTVNEEFDIKQLVVLSNELVRCLYTKLSGFLKVQAGLVEPLLNYKRRILDTIYESYRCVLLGADVLGKCV